eukprot:CAMPEP_0204328942 /NCGR_PEP_ID=MMETSP0469-20131031/13791_1 /ASSEMBLY_ACC=CAM_ASM_000384 /TAXON_ID=2969 /ORGANISM="Oxyrrhis marina" /LENGTH=134 /DNA_ID=CAMNT_0051311461 /DNA_START=1 /DNA_END=405 /DNA_ORIENTATION=+
MTSDWANGPAAHDKQWSRIDSNSPLSASESSSSGTPFSQLATPTSHQSETGSDIGVERPNPRRAALILLARKISRIHNCQCFSVWRAWRRFLRLGLETESVMLMAQNRILREQVEVLQDVVVAAKLQSVLDCGV